MSSYAVDEPNINIELDLSSTFLIIHAISEWQISCFEMSCFNDLHEEKESPSLVPALANECGIFLINSITSQWLKLLANRQKDKNLKEE